MKKKSAIIIAILIMCVGFAAISTTLVINGNAKVGENTDDFSVIFTAATLDGQDVYASVIDDTKKIITFETSDLKALNQTSVLNYEVTNNSSNYDAEVQVNCKVKDDAEAKYTSIKNELEENTTIVKAKNTVGGTLTVTLNKTATEEVKEEYICELTFTAVERDTVGKAEPRSFKTDSWETIQKAVQTGNTSKYNVGDTKEVDLGELGIHPVRISNMSECTSGEESETACGFVVEFADVVTKQKFNSTATDLGGWRDSELRVYINGTFFNLLPSDLQSVIATTKVISGHGKNDSANFETQDKLYLLNAHEIYEAGTNAGKPGSDTSFNATKQLDYYKNKNVTDDNYADAAKKYKDNFNSWWLRSPNYYANGDSFLHASGNGGNWNNDNASVYNGISPAFRIA